MSINKAKQVNDLHETIHEMATSSGAVKGQQFVDVALGAFECLQVIEIVAIIASDSDDMEEAELEALMDQASITLGSLMVKLASGVSDADREEAGNLATQMMDRKLKLQEQISGS